MPSKPRKEPRGRLSLRIPASLLERIQEAAEGDHRSVNSWAIAIFEAALRERGKSRT